MQCMSRKIYLYRDPEGPPTVRFPVRVQCNVYLGPDRGIRRLADDGCAFVSPLETHQSSQLAMAIAEDITDEPSTPDLRGALPLMNGSSKVSQSPPPVLVCRILSNSLKSGKQNTCCGVLMQMLKDRSFQQ